MTHGKPLLLTVLILLFGLGKVLRAQILFSEVTSEAGIDHAYSGIDDTGAGLAFFDMDNDGDEDLWLSGGINRDALYENDGTGHFTEIGEAAGLIITRNIITTGVITGDLDNDGDKDVMLITHKGFSIFILKNKGDKTFELASRTGLENPGFYSMAAAMADINNDGYLDIYSGNYIKRGKLTYSTTNPDSIVGFDHSCYENKLYLNNGDFSFTDVSQSWKAADEGCTLAALFSDYDGDFDPDLLVVNDFGQWVIPNALLQNEQDSFVNVSSATGMNVGLYGMGVAVGDYDNDLDLDYYITNIGANVLLHNNGDGTYTDKAELRGVQDAQVTEELFTTGWGTAFIDFDNDTDLDLYVANGYISAASFIDNAKENPNRCFENDGKGNFQRIAEGAAVASSSRSRGFVYADIDNDGDLDLAVANANRNGLPDSIQKVQLFRNDSQGQNNWLKLKLEGTRNNRDGYGTQVRIKAEGRWYMREANGGFGTHASQHSTIAHFGLGSAPIVDSLLVYWQGGQLDVYTDIAVNQTLQLTESSVVSTLDPLSGKTGLELHCYPNPFRGTIRVDYYLPKPSRVTIQIVDQVGAILFQETKQNEPKGPHQFIQHFSQKGLFFIRLITTEGMLYKPVHSN